VATEAQKTNRWTWIPSLYFAEGLPFVAAMTVSVIMYKRLDISNTELAFFTSWLYLPWVIKPLWSPIVDILKTRRFWIVAMQLLIGAGFAAVALSLSADNFFRYSLAAFWLIAFSSATHDIAADGFTFSACRIMSRPGLSVSAIPFIAWR
jgi:PAT family beta-lactamase induction signal transducer AmpG